MVSKWAWKKNKERIQPNNKTLYFDHDYTAEVVKKRKDYNGIKKALKVKGICFQTPYVNMPIHWETGARLYSSAEEARAELRRQGFAMEEATPTRGAIDWGARLGELLGSWQKATGHRGAEDDVSRRARHKLQSFQSDHTAQRGSPAQGK